MAVIDVIAGIVWIKPGLAEALRLLGRSTGLLLLAIGHDDAVIVLGVLQIVLRQHGIAGRGSIAGERHVFFGYVHGGATHLYVGSIRLVAARERVLALALTTAMIAMATAAPTVLMAAAIVAPVVLLSWPHG